MSSYRLPAGFVRGIAAAAARRDPPRHSIRDMTEVDR